MSMDCITDLNLYIRFIIIIGVPAIAVILIKVAGPRKLWPCQRKKTYKVHKEGVIREEFESNSSTIGDLKVGEKIISLEERVNDDGEVSIHFKRGWVAKTDVFQINLVGPIKLWTCKRRKVYKVHKQGVISEGFESNSSTHLKVGEEIISLEERVNKDGEVTHIRFDRGWTIENENGHARMRFDRGWVIMTSLYDDQTKNPETETEAEKATQYATCHELTKKDPKVVIKTVEMGSVWTSFCSEQTANQICLLIIFLVYPTLMTTIFTMFACRDLDFEQSFHIYDPSIDCNLAMHTRFEVAAVVLVALLPVGIPVGFFIMLYRARHALREGGTIEFDFDAFKQLVEKLDPQHFKEHFSGTAGETSLRSMFDEIDVDHSDSVNSEELMRYYNYKVGMTSAPSERITIGMEDAKETRERLKFLVKSFKPQHWYFEIVSYSKKFILAGILIFAEPGSTSQLYVGLVTSFFFFAVLVKKMPYRMMKTNWIAIIAEFNLFFTILCLLMMKINLAGVPRFSTRV
jgi:hypothetical protein